MKDARPRSARYSDERDAYIHVLSARLPAFVLHLEGNLRTIVLDATVDLLLSHAVMMSFFLGNAGSGYASRSFTTSRKRTLEYEHRHFLPHR